MEPATHWNQVYATKTDQDVSWTEAVPTVSLQWLERLGLSAETCVIDVGGGNSRLADELLRRGLRCLTVLDVSPVALERARTRLGDAATVPTWIAADVAGDWSCRPVDIWHDRAVFHFLTAPEARAGYCAHLRETLKIGGSAIIATFALDGPERCSGLPVCRYSPLTLAQEIGEGFTLVESLAHAHRTPWGAAQSFQYSRFVRTG